MPRGQISEIDGRPRPAEPAGPRYGAVVAGLLALGLWTAVASQLTSQAVGHMDHVLAPGNSGRLDPLSLSSVGRLGPGRLERILQRVANAPDACLKAGSIDRRSAQKTELSRLFETLAKSPLARRLMHQAGRIGVYVCADPATRLLGYYLAGLRLIGLNPGLSEGQKIAFLAHELAHVPQHNTYSDNRYFPPDDLILLRRVREATAEALATRIVWQLRTAGYHAAWEEKATDRFYGDIAQAFAAAQQAVPTPHGELIATRAAFDRWFALPDRLDLYDRMTVDHLKRISGDRMGLVSPRKALSHAFLSGIARLADGSPLFSTMGRPLTDDYYRGQISVRNTALLECILESARTWPPTIARESPHAPLSTPPAHRWAASPG